MPVFKDALNRDWTVDIGVGALKRIKSLTGMELDSLVAMPDAKKKSKAEREAEAEVTMKPLHEFLMDMARFSEVLYAIVKPQADDKDISHEHFDDGLSGGAIEDAQIAFLKALEDFFHQAPRKMVARGLLEMAKQMKKLNQAGLKRAETKIAAMAAQTEATASAQMEVDLDEAFSKSATELPGSAAESTQAPSLSAN